MKKININKQNFNRLFKRKYKLNKKFIVLVLLFLIIKPKYNLFLINNKKTYIPKILNWRTSEIDKLYNFLNLKNKPINNSDPLIFKEKNEFINHISMIIKNKNFSLDCIYLTGQLRFGNFLISLNNAIFYCEILGCRKIIIQKYNALYIKNIILNSQYNMTIEPSYLNHYLLKKCLVIPAIFFFYYYKYIKPDIRFNLIKNEILNNLPKLQINPNDLYIHIRSGDIFINHRSNPYSQPPLCFYKTILNKFKFRQVFIIAENENNPIINIILSEYKYVQYKKNPLNVDISILANSYNIVSSASSFVNSIIKLNDKLKLLWEYDFYRLSQRYFHLHYSVYNFPHKYTIYKMIPSKLYIKNMFTWSNSIEQRNLMIKEKCRMNFKKITPSI